MMADTPSSPMNSPVSTTQGTFPNSMSGSCEHPNNGASSSSLLWPNADNNDNDESNLFSISWNRDYNCFVAGTSPDFRIYNCEPFKETFRRDLKGGGFKIVEILFRSNILALVDAVANSYYPPNKVLIWDDHQSRYISEFTFRSEVHGVKLRRDRIVVVIKHKIYVYHSLEAIEHELSSQV